MKDGIINIDKPAGWTSQDVCARLRHRLHIKKIGHTGTLDPMATGVLPVCLGKATRIIEYYDRDRKTYHASMKLGTVTDTLDITGEVVETHGYAGLSETAVREAFAVFSGRVSQIPPKYSALRINGKRAYDLARSGIDFEIKPRVITIYSNEISRIDLDAGEIEFDVTCSKGTYIRSICDDIGRRLGCGAVMTSLRRTASGVFRIEDAIGIEEFCALSDAEIPSHIIPMQQAESPERQKSTGGQVHSTLSVDGTLAELGRIGLKESRAAAFMNGNSSYLTQCRILEKSRFDDIYRVYSGCVRGQDAGTFIGTGVIEGDSLRPLKVLAR